MRKIILGVIALMLFGCSNLKINFFAKKYSDLYDDGDKLFYKGKPFTGKMVGYHDNGQLWEKAKYANGLRNGLWKEYGANGKVVNKGSFINGRPVGSFYSESTYYPNMEFLSNRINHSKIKIEYTDDSKVSNKKVELSEYYVLRTMLKEELKINDKKEGVWKYYNKEGTLIKKETYNEDDLVKKEIYVDEKSIKKAFVFINLFEPSIQTSRIHVDGELIKREEITVSYGNKILLKKGLKINDKKEGVWKYYNKEEKLIKKETYKDGEKISEKCWNKNGNKIECE
jgi:antitoxin component YwqK of YwqJK toxin-antitoxin module